MIMGATSSAQEIYLKPCHMIMTSIFFDLNESTGILTTKKVFDFESNADAISVQAKDEYILCEQTFLISFSGYYENNAPQNLQASGKITTSAKGQFLQSLISHWLIASEKLVSEAYGLFADPADSFNLVVDENGVQGGASAYVQSSGMFLCESQVIKIHFDLPDFNGSFLVGQSNIDLTVAKHLTVALLAQNTYMGDLAGGDPSRDMTWFVEGLGKFITGNDGYTKTAIDSIGLAALLQKTGQLWT